VHPEQRQQQRLAAQQAPRQAERYGGRTNCALNIRFAGICNRRSTCTHTMCSSSMLLHCSQYIAQHLFCHAWCASRFISLPSEHIACHYVHFSCAHQNSTCSMTLLRSLLRSLIPCRMPCAALMLAAHQPTPIDTLPHAAHSCTRFCPAGLPRAWQQIQGCREA
jgi:hypothetical protein